MAEAQTVHGPDDDLSAKPAATEGPQPTATGQGVQAVQQLLARGGMPAPDAVVAIIDAHRAEHDQIFALLQSTLGNGYVQRVVAAMDHLRASVAQREVVAGDPANPNGGYFDASQALGGAKWRTANGAFSGTANQDGLDSRYQVDHDDAAHLRVDKGGAGTLAWEHDGHDEGELEGRYKSGADWEVGARRTDQLGGGALTYGARHQVTSAGASDGVTGEWASTDGKQKLGGTAAIQGGDGVGEIHGSDKLASGKTVAGSFDLAREGTGARETLSGSYGDGNDKLSGNLTHHANGSLTGGLTDHHQLGPHAALDASLTRAADRTTLGISGSAQTSEHNTLSGDLAYTQPDHGGGQAELGLHDHYKSDKVVGGLDVGAGVGTRDHLSVTGSTDFQIAQGVYGGAFGSYATEGGKHDTASAGASLTFTPNEKTALTLAGVIDQTGALETRLQLDVFKQKIASVGDLADHKKDALLSLFVSYTQGGQPGMLNDRLGMPQQSYGRAANEGQVQAGIRIKF